jgi:hypothetical protein
MDHLLGSSLASTFAGIALSHVTREYPHKLDHVLKGPEDLKSPSTLHPLFYGSFDWHSNVHAYWLLATLYRREREFPERAEIATLFDARFTPENVAGELAYLGQPAHGTFERPYGWAWLLMLAAELARHNRPWAATLAPLAAAFRDRFRDWLPKATYPIRTGSHSNTAFAFALALEFQDAALQRLIRHKAREWYGNDGDCQAWEPGGDDFLSPTLVEAECMRRAIEPAEWRPWFDRFLPRAAFGEPATLFAPAVVSDRDDGRIVHLDGLNLSRAWCWRAIASALDHTDPRRRLALEAVERHVTVSLPHLTDHYMGEHWLATFALLALLDVGVM